MRRRARILVPSVLLAVVATAAVGASSAAESGPARPARAPRVVGTDRLAVELSPAGAITGLRRDGGRSRIGLQGQTRLAGCRRVGDVSAAPMEGGGLVFRSRLVLSEDGAKTCDLLERFRPAGGGVRWEIEIRGTGAPWSAPIETHLEWPGAERALFWTAWGDSRADNPPHSLGWSDPLVPRLFTDLELSYGSRRFFLSQATSLPIATVIEPDADRGVSLILSPADLTLDMDLTVTRTGHITFSRSHLRITRDHPVRFTADLVAHAGDWRAALDHLVRRYPRFFDPPNPRANAIAGCGAYSSHAALRDPMKLARMGFRVNWKASFDFPYMGMFLPPVAGDREWIDFKGKPISIQRMREHSRRMAAMGFFVLNYFNVTEFGTRIAYPPPPRKAADPGDLWKDANDFLYGRLAGAILPGAGGKPIGTWEGAVAMDPGEPAYARFLLEQARRHVAAFPESAGICIDRMDWLRHYNPRRDDGVSWYGGKAARSLVVSWHGLMARLGPMLHDAGKVIFCNPHYRRLDLLERVDGIYDEFGQYGHSLNLCAFLGLRKPVLGWTTAAVVEADPDAYFQRYLHMGAFPTAPVPGNDHCIAPTPQLERYYVDYGPLLDALGERRWVLSPHAVTVDGGKARANVFAVPGGYAVPVTFGQKAERAGVALRLPAAAKITGDAGGLRGEAVLPGGRRVPVALEETAGTWHAVVPLKRGCAVLTLLHTWIDPPFRFFSLPAKVTAGTAIEGARIRYTLDGTAPTPSAPLLTRPLVLNATATVTVAACRAGRLLGSAVRARFVKLPPQAPRIDAPGGIVDRPVPVSMEACAPFSSDRIHYTLDGSEPTGRSPSYAGPIRIATSTVIRARIIDPRCEPGIVATASLRKRPPPPPPPRVRLDQRKPLESTVGWGGKARVNRSIQDRPLSVGGKRYEHGMGVHAPSRLSYAVKPGDARFVATVGIDDEMAAFAPASVVFRVLVDGKARYETPVLRPREIWYIDVPLPRGARVVTLLADDAGDGRDGDHADWVDAGFIGGSP